MDRRRLDEIAHAATVAPVEVEIEGWRCKAAPDLPFRRCNVALPPVDVAEDHERFARQLADVRDWYRSQGLRLIVQVSSATPGWEQVDAWLADGGLGIEAPVQVMAAEACFPCGRCIDDARARVTVTQGIDAAWADAYGALFGGSPVEVARTTAYGRMLAGLGARALGAACRVDGQTVGVGFGVLDDGWMGVFGMVTAAGHRRGGVAHDVLLALQLAADDLGIRHAYLQVEPDNTAALGVYDEREFELSHRYHYRSEGSDPDQGC
jgi:GNAT superfamily N-acetyltransferase